MSRTRTEAGAALSRMRRPAHARRPEALAGTGYSLLRARRHSCLHGRFLAPRRAQADAAKNAELPKTGDTANAVKKEPAVETRVDDNQARGAEAAVDLAERKRQYAALVSTASGDHAWAG